MKTTVKYGTSHFPSLSHAIAYYKPQGFSGEDVKRKLDEGEIFIGKPEIKPGESLIEKDFRYHVCEAATHNKMKSLTILGRRWFQKSAGNTYHTVTVMIDGLTVYKSPVTYGYDNAYLQTASEWLVSNGYIPDANGHLRIYCEENGIAFEYSSSDMRREKDL